MQIIDSLLSIYDKKSSDCQCCSDKWIVTEPETVSKFKKISIYKKGAIFGIIDNDFYKGLSKITNERSSFLADKDCDGVSFCELDGKTHLLLLDLKSSLSDIEKAFKQDFFTLLKIHMFLSLCDGYDIERLSIDFFVATQPCKNDDERSDILQRLNMAEMSESLRYTDRCFLDYLCGGTGVRVELGELPFLKDSKLHKAIMSANVRLHIYTPPKYGDIEGEMDLGDYF